MIDFNAATILAIAAAGDKLAADLGAVIQAKWQMVRDNPHGIFIWRRGSKWMNWLVENGERTEEEFVDFREFIEATFDLVLVKKAVK